MVKQLQGAAIAVEVVAEAYPNGRFAHLSDPEGNRIELFVQTPWYLPPISIPLRPSR